MIRALLAKLFPVHRVQGEGEKCANCIYFIDYSDTEPADECNGYCSYDFVKGHKENPYGGYWSHTESWCPSYERGDSLWVNAREQADTKGGK